MSITGKIIIFIYLSRIDTMDISGTKARNFILVAKYFYFFCEELIRFSFNDTDATRSYSRKVHLILSGY